MKKLIGIVGVDSGQLLILDPCYIESHWVENTNCECRKIKHIETGEIIKERLWDTPIPQFDNKTLNQMAEAEEIEILPYEETGELSYRECCAITLNREYGCIKKGLATVSSTLYGDGEYPVYAEMEGISNRPKRIIIELE